MATYKVIQDIEAEDKFIGPLTLKQFVFAMGGAFFGWVSFFFLSEFAWGMIVSLPLSLFGFFMAFPWSKEQPTDVWVLAKIRFYFKPKKRIWDQSGRQELVTITAPKKIDRPLTKNFSEKEVKSRLRALADTIDSRGWAVKHATAGEAGADLFSSDRLVSPAILPQQVPDNNYDLPDILENSAKLDRVDTMLDETGDKQRSQIVEKMDRIRSGELEDPSSDQAEVVVAPPEEDAPHKPKRAADRIDEMLLSKQIKAKKAAGDLAYSRMSKVPAKSSSSTSSDDSDDQKDAKAANTKSHKPASKTTDKKSTSTVTDQISPDILNLARNNDLNVATIARQAKNDKSDDDEVVISLH